VAPDHAENTGRLGFEGDPRGWGCGELLTPPYLVSESERCHAKADLMLHFSLTAILRDERLSYVDLAEFWRRRAEEAALRESKIPTQRNSQGRTGRVNDPTPYQEPRV
jgi:hypothetical protein